MRLRYRIQNVIIFLLIAGIVIQVTRCSDSPLFFKANQEKIDFSYKTESSEYIPKQFSKVLVLYSSNIKDSVALLNNTKEVFRLAKVKYYVIDISKTKKLDSLESYQIVFIATEGIEEINKKIERQIKAYVKNGGNIASGTRSDSKLNGLFGIVKVKGYKEDVRGIKFKNKFFPGLENIKLKGDFFVNSCLNVVLDSKVEIIAYSYEGIPLIWSYEYGKGRTIFFNGSILDVKANRGLLLSFIGYTPSYFLTSIVNTKIAHIDDFPAPIKPGQDDVIYREYRMNNIGFYRNIWWSHMANFAKKYRIVYTGFLVSIYNLNVKGKLPKPFNSDIDDLDYFGRKLTEAHGELGIHGYNHNSLATKGEMEFKEYGYKPWPSQQQMEKSLIVVKEVINKIYGDINIYSYVPPSNILGLEGKKALKNVFPELKVLAGIYTGAPEKGVLYQEFGPDPDIPELYCLPRISAGYLYSSEKMWEIYNAIATFGYVSHFVHPDDLLDEQRSGNKNWKDLSAGLEGIYSDIFKHFSFLRPTTTVQAYKEFLKYDDLKLVHKQEGNSIKIYYKNAAFPTYHFLRLRDNKIQKVKNGDFALIDVAKGYDLYVIKGEGVTVDIVLK